MGLERTANTLHLLTETHAHNVASASTLSNSMHVLELINAQGHQMPLAIDTYFRKIVHSFREKVRHYGRRRTRNENSGCASPLLKLSPEVHLLILNELLVSTDLLGPRTLQRAAESDTRKSAKALVAGMGSPRYSLTHRRDCAPAASSS